jgi:small subunit ribosomal protein S3
MGQKVNPIGLRLGINRTWDSRWFANTGEYGKLLHEDIKIRKYLEKELKQAASRRLLSSVLTRSAASPSMRRARA